LGMAIFSFRVWCFRCFFMRSLHYLNGGTLLYFRLKRNRPVYPVALPYFRSRVEGTDGLIRNRDSASPRFCMNASD
jgi:hypothetical protein